MVISNGLGPIYIYTGHRNYRELVRNLEGVKYQVQLATEGSRLVWFYRHSFYYDYYVEELEELPGLELVAALDDGVIFRRDGTLVDYSFDAHLSRDAVVYSKEPCLDEDTEAKFFLHLVPVNVDDLPAARRQYGFDNLDFAFGQYGAIADWKCLASVPLPDYPVTAIRTGQYIIGIGRLWQAELSVPSE